MTVYIAGPYSADDDEGRLANTQRAMRTMVLLMSAGHAPYCPHTSHYTDLCAEETFGERLTWNDWMELHLAFLPACEALLRLPGTSRGADIEVAEAKRLGIPVYYDINDLLYGEKG